MRKKHPSVYYSPPLKRRRYRSNLFFFWFKIQDGFFRERAGHRPPSHPSAPTMNGCRVPGGLRHSERRPFFPGGHIHMVDDGTYIRSSTACWSVACGWCRRNAVHSIVGVCGQNLRRASAASLTQEDKQHQDAPRSTKADEICWGGGFPYRPCPLVRHTRSAAPKLHFCP